MVIAVIDILFQNTLKMVLIDDQNMIETFFALNVPNVPQKNWLLELDKGCE